MIATYEGTVMENNSNTSLKINSILIVDDDPEICELLDDYLTDQSFNVECAANGEIMKDKLKQHVPDLILLDINMPGEDGLVLAKYIRQRYQIGVIMVTGANATVDKIIGLELGADDYISKPFELREVLARVRSVLRRYGDNAKEAKSIVENKPHINVGNYIFELDSRRLFDKKGEELSITNMEFEVLRVFTQHPNKVLSRDDLLNMTKNRDWDPFDRSIDIHVARLRQKIEDNPKSPQVIKTVRGAGYMFVSNT